MLWGAWSPDGSRLALILELDGSGYEVVVADVDGSDPVTIVEKDDTGAVGPTSSHSHGPRTVPGSRTRAGRNSEVS